MRKLNYKTTSDLGEEIEKSQKIKLRKATVDLVNCWASADYGDFTEERVIIKDKNKLDIDMPTDIIVNLKLRAFAFQA